MEHFSSPTQKMKLISVLSYLPTVVLLLMVVFVQYLLWQQQIMIYRNENTYFETMYGISDFFILYYLLFCVF